MWHLGENQPVCESMTFSFKKKKTYGCEGLQVLIGAPTYRLASKAYSSHYMENALPWADGQPGEGMPDMQRLF